MLVGWVVIARIVTAQALIETHKVNVIAVFNQTALLCKGKSILSCLQMEHYGAEINDKSLKLPGGMQHILMAFHTSNVAHLPMQRLLPFLT
jgi:hypothetical protein